MVGDVLEWLRRRARPDYKARLLTRAVARARAGRLGPHARSRKLRRPLLEIKTVRLEENTSEKIARLNRTTTARDMYDLAWICSQGRLWGELDKALIRRLAVLKVWTDSNGIHANGTT